MKGDTLRAKYPAKNGWQWTNPTATVNLFVHTLVFFFVEHYIALCCLDTNKPLQLLRGLPQPSSNDTSSRRRRKRNIHDNFVETLVVADKTMVDAFDNKADLQSYIITLMGVVSIEALDSLIVYFYLSCHATLYFARLPEFLHHPKRGLKRASPYRSKTLLMSCAQRCVRLKTLSFRLYLSFNLFQCREIHFNMLTCVSAPKCNRNFALWECSSSIRTWRHDTRAERSHDHPRLNIRLCVKILNSRAPRPDTSKT